jgi:hypothetical protein
MHQRHGRALDRYFEPGRGELNLVRRDAAVLEDLPLASIGQRERDALRLRLGERSANQEKNRGESPGRHG